MLPNLTVNGFSVLKKNKMNLYKKCGKRKANDNYYNFFVCTISVIAESNFYKLNNEKLKEKEVLL